MSSTYEKPIMPSFIWVAIISDSSFVVFGLRSFHLWEILIMCLDFACECAQVGGSYPSLLL